MKVENYFFCPCIRNSFVKEEIVVSLRGILELYKMDKLKVYSDIKQLLIVAFLAISVFSGYAQSFTLLGTVVNEKDQPMKDVTVYVKETGKNEIFTNSDGWFKIVLSDTEKQNTVVFSFSGYKTQEYQVKTKENNIRIVMVESVDPPDVTDDAGTLYGTIKDRETGAIIPFANVSVMTKRGTVVMECQTDFYGKYTTRAISPGNYTLQVTSIGYQTLQIKIVVGADEAVPKDITLQPTTDF